ncbi:MAG TPA: ABC transporter permease subunit [Anaerolineales bacterium]|nr:ABC transporter permease subunit [Anaerolineales bacterium]
MTPNLRTLTTFWQTWSNRLGFENPLLNKELRSRMRGRRWVFILTLYLALIAMAILSLYLAFSSSSSFYTDERQWMGKAVFGLVVGLQALLVSFITPALTATAISGERERQTFDLLRTTLLRPRSIIFGKVSSAVAFVLLLLIASFPMQALAFLLGGVAPSEFFISIAMLLVTTLVYASIGIMISTFLKRSLTAIVVSYALILVIFFFVPILFWTFTGISSSILFSTPTPASPTREVLFYLAIGILLCLNPISAAVFSEYNLIENQRLWLVEIPLQNGSSVTLPSPWWIYLLIFSLLAILFLYIATWRVRRVDP